MDSMNFDRENVELIGRGQVDEVERRLAVNYEMAKIKLDLATLLHAISALARFYALPFKEDLLRAEQYFRQRFEMLPGADACLDLITFYCYTLQDPNKTLGETGRMRSLTDKATARDLRFLYPAVAMEGQAHLILGHDQDAIRSLEELLDMADRDPEHVPFGDEFNFVELMIKRDLAKWTCRQLLNIARRRVRSV